jgi:4-amino-4-deoxy-L-arabinose transferase-like glycosyltransferase
MTGARRTGDGIGAVVRDNRWLLVILALFLVLATSYSVIVPLGEGPDEVPHFTYVRYLTQHGRLPVGAEEHEGFQPPLYYFLGAGATFWIDTSDYAIRANGDYSFTEDVPPFNLLLHTARESFPYRGWALAWHVIRFLSVLLGATTVWATYRIAREVFPDDEWIAVGAAALNAFLPQFLFISGLVNNDNLAASLSALMLLVTVKIVRGSRAYRHFLLLGTLTALGVMAKTSVLNFYAIILLVVGIVVWQEKRGPRSSLRRGVVLLFLSALPFLVIDAWWFVRNQLLYGDPLGWGLVLAANALREGPLTVGDIQWLIWGLYRSFWYRWIGIELELPFYATLAIPCLAAVAGLLTLFWRRERLSPGSPLILSVLGLFFVMVSGSLIPWTATVQGTDQARLLYPALPSIVLFMFLGWAQLVPRGYTSHLAIGVGAAMFLFAMVAPLRYTMPTYAPPPILSTEDLADVEQRVDIDFGNKIKLVGYELNGQEWRPGEDLVVTMYWEALEDLDEDYWLLFRLVHRRGHDLTFKDGCPSAGRYTTDHWRKGDIIPSEHRLSIPEDAAAHRYRLTLSMHPFDSEEWLPVLNEEGEVTGDIVILTLIPVVAGDQDTSAVRTFAEARLPCCPP